MFQSKGGAQELVLRTLFFVLCPLMLLESPWPGWLRIKVQSTKYQDRLAFNKKAATGAASRCSFCCRSLNNHDPFVLIKVSQHDFDNLTLFRRHKLANVIRLNRQLTMFVATINQHCELHASWPAEIDQLVQRRAHGTTRSEEHTSE